LWPQNKHQARRYPLINKATVSQILPLITSTIDSSLDEVEQVLVISKNMYLEGTYRLRRSATLSSNHMR
jgi:hypothetical protein